MSSSIESQTENLLFSPLDQQDKKLKERLEEIQKRQKIIKKQKKEKKLKELPELPELKEQIENKKEEEKKEKEQIEKHRQDKKQQLKDLNKQIELEKEQKQITHRQTINKVIYCNDILFLILSLMDWQQLLQTYRLVCKDWNNIILNSSSLWKQVTILNGYNYCTNLKSN